MSDAESVLAVLNHRRSKGAWFGRNQCVVNMHPFCGDAAKDALDDMFRWIPHSMRTSRDFEQLVAKAYAERSAANRRHLSPCNEGLG